MQADVATLIKETERLAESGDLNQAIHLLDHALREHGSELKLWIARSYISELRCDYAEARDSMNRAIAIDPSEPILYYNRGRFSYHFDNLRDALMDFTHGLALCDSQKNDYYRQEFHFWRAETRLRMGDKGAAIDDLRHLEDGFRSWTDRLKTKEELLAECR